MKNISSRPFEWEKNRNKHASWTARNVLRPLLCRPSTNTLEEVGHHSRLVEGVVGHNLAVAVDRTLAAVVGRNPAAVAGHNLVEDPAHNPAEEAVDRMAAGHIPAEVADRIRTRRHTVQRAVAHTDLAVRPGGTLVHLGCHMKNQ